ncbi:cytochrome P450 93A2-like [Herrania umbratica]|uniref:Cytochrome P450 93A2-like n=1 Tax=Herrania umbratica TaxID=108875 RepID=A0A6J1A7L3_9ROSI|nr:cytochrome P450 93A2-like [Herrania umbratica]
MSDLGDHAILVTVCLATIVLFLAIFAKTRAKGRRPPSPPALPIIGHLHLLRPIPHQGLHKLSTRYGPIVSFYLGSKHCVLVSSPDIAEEFLKTNEASYLDRPKMANFDYLTYGTSDFSTAPYGPRWKLMKKLCMSELLGPRTLEKLLPIRREEIRSFLKMTKKKADKGEPIDVVAELMTLTNNTISRMTVSYRCSGDENKANEIRNMMREMNGLGTKFNLADVIWFCKNLDLQGFRKRLVEVRRRYDTMMERIIKEHEEERRKRKEMGNEGDTVKDLLDVLLDIYEDESAEVRLTRENIKAFILNLFGAGTDTSSTTMGWGLAELINNPNVIEKARQEIDSVVGRKRILEESDVANLPYLQAVVKETLRLHPSGPFIVRESTKACVIAGYEIPADTRLYVNVWSLGRNTKQWKNHLEFRPERFLNREEWQGKSQWLDVMGQDFNLLPFGSGRRSCPGASLALSIVSTVLGCMIQCFEWNLGNGGNGRADMEETDGMTLLRANDLLCFPVARLSPFPSLEE